MSYLMEGAVQSLSIYYLPMAQVKKPTLLKTRRGQLLENILIREKKRSWSFLKNTEKYFFVGSITS